MEECSGRKERKLATQELDLEEVEEKIAKLLRSVSDIIPDGRRSAHDNVRNVVTKEHAY